MKFLKYVLILSILSLISGCSQTSIGVSPDNITATVTQPTDEVTGALLTLDYEHHEQHEGSHFFIKTYVLETGG